MTDPNIPRHSPFSRIHRTFRTKSTFQTPKSSPKQPNRAKSTLKGRTPHPEAHESREKCASTLFSRDFILLVAGQGISLFGNLMLRFAMAMWVLDETGSATVFASILAISVVPTIILSPFGGVLADRMNRRTIMVALDAISAVLVLASAIVFAAIGFSLVAIGTMQVLLAILGAFETPTVQAALPQMFREHGQSTLRQAMAVVNQVQQLGSLLPSFLGGVLYSLTGIQPMMAIAIVSFAGAATLECFIRLAAPDRGTEELPTPLEDLKSGIRFLIKDRPNVFALLLFAAGLNFVIIGNSAVGFPYVIRTVLGFDATVYGVADGLVGVSGVVGAFVAGFFAAKLTMRKFPLSMAALALSLLPQGLVFLLPVSAWVKLIVLVGFTFGTMIASCFSNLIALPTIQLNTPDAMTGKVMAMVAAISMCAQPLGQMAYGWAFDHMSVAAVLLISAGLLGLGVAVSVQLAKRFAD
ncbi:MFS transporter [Bifidobacterium felsineum]|uniref:MFS transporter n=1 Tax=Bifidobacterium felsineum TaxID=2045440 RepID=UPI001BDC341D|nr:MFS transporter [Bifidobacterium felsineum]MBT1164363.1 MFS transporter [Bifidobacterium felsineum]